MNRILKVLVLCLIASTSLRAQTITEYSGFRLEARKLIWIHIYERPGIDSLALQAAIKKQIETKDNSCELISEEAGLLVYKVTDKLFDPKGALISGRLQIDIKPGRYRTTFSTITYKYGARQKAMYESLTQSKLDPGPRAFEESLLEKDGTSIKKKSLKSLDQSSLIYQTAFDFNFKKDDW